jgi:transposase InsO family protein
MHQHHTLLIHHSDQGSQLGLNRLELQSATFEYIEAFYNRQRRHSTLSMLSPVDYEQLQLSPLGS